MNKITLFYIAGLKFRPEEDLKNLATGLVLKLEHEPDNQFDGDAVKILDKDGKHVGYVPKKETEKLHPYRITGIPIYVVLANYIPEMPSHRQALVTVSSKYNLPHYISDELKEKAEEEFRDFVCLNSIDEEPKT